MRMIAMKEFLIQMMDKVKMQLSSMFEDADASVVSHLVHLIAQSAPTMDSSFRDDCKFEFRKAKNFVY